MTWTPDDIQRSEPLPVKVTIKLDGRSVRQIDDIAAAAECSRPEIARRLLVAVLEDDRAAEGGAT